MHIRMWCRSHRQARVSDRTVLHHPQPVPNWELNDRIAVAISCPQQPHPPILKNFLLNLGRIGGALPSCGEAIATRQPSRRARWKYQPSRRSALPMMDPPGDQPCRAKVSFCVDGQGYPDSGLTHQNDIPWHDTSLVGISRDSNIASPFCLPPSRFWTAISQGPESSNW